MVTAVTTASLISLFFVLMLQKLYKGGKIEELEWDIATVTAGDYTVEFDIPKHNYYEWYNNMYKRSSLQHTFAGNMMAVVGAGTLKLSVKVGS